MDKAPHFLRPILVHDSSVGEIDWRVCGERAARRRMAAQRPSTPRRAVRAKRPTPMARKAFRDSGHFKGRTILGAKPGRSRGEPVPVSSRRILSAR